MKTILFFTTPNEHSLEKNLWQWKSPEEDPCKVLPLPSPASKGEEWKVIVYKVLGCNSLYNEGWKYDELESIIKQKSGVNKNDVNECAVFVHTDPHQLSVLVNKFSSKERKRIFFLEYSSTAPLYKTHIEPFAENPEEHLFNKLWNGPVKNRRTESIIKQLCKLRYELLVPLVTWDLLCKIGCGNNLDSVKELKETLSTSCLSDRDLNKLRTQFSQICSEPNDYKTLIGPSNSISSNYKMIRQWHNDEKQSSEEIKGLAELINDCNQAIKDKRKENNV